ncbi:MAG: DJ-1/PfpI family protein [Defluviitaleaceae bacterium]|nr:DJ-1/PfpI family protein [Defluviitaleaceae bacterium]
MQSGKKVAFLIYPMFCNYEIALTLAALESYGKELVVFAKDKSTVKCEEGMTVVPDKTLDEFEIDGYDCLLLSGIGGDPAGVIYDDVYMHFLKQFIGKDDITIASISISPVLLARAGLLKNKKFCVGMYEEARDELNFFEYENQQRAPIVVDGNVITAMGMAFREFAIEIIRKLGYECKSNLWGEIKYPINPEDYIFRYTSD